jgi:hypothetical protein
MLHKVTDDGFVASRWHCFQLLPEPRYVVVIMVAVTELDVSQRPIFPQTLHRNAARRVYRELTSADHRRLV